MMLLIRNLTEITISSVLPLPFQMGLGDDLSRIHFYRNKIAHVDDATISDTEFTKYWDEITQVTILRTPPLISYNDNNSCHTILQEIYCY